MRIGIVGAGRIGMALAGHATEAGHEVTVANSRGPASLAEHVAALGNRARAGTVVEAVDTDVVVAAVPWAAMPALGGSVSDWDGRVVVDPSNAFALPDYRVIDLGESTSSEVVAGLLPGAKVVKAFNTLTAERLAEDPAVGGGRRVVFVAGDHDDATARVVEFADSIGFAPLALGPLAAAGRLFQAGGPLAFHDLVKRSR